MLSKRLFHSTQISSARLIGSAVSVSIEHARTLPPAPPLPARPAPPPPRPPTAPPANPIKPPSQAIPPELAHQVGVPKHPISAANHPRLSQASTPSATESFDKRAAEAARAAQQSEEDAQAAVQLDLYLLRVLTQLQGEAAMTASSVPEQGWMDLPSLVRQSKEKAGKIAEGLQLPYEPTPGPSRRVRLDGNAGAVEPGPAEEQDGVVVVAHVIGEQNRVSVCSGFAVGAAAEGKGQMVLTCAHTLDGMEQYLRSRDSSASPSATFILTSTGHIYTVSSLISSLPASDLLLLRLSSSPVHSPATSLTCPPLRSLPINPYPSPTSTPISVHRYLNPLSRLRRKLQRLPERDWAEGTIVEYKDSIGRTAETGTYDDLANMWLDCTPTPGSSGGPVVDRQTGSVVGVTRGSTHKYGERTQYGFATPAERILDMFAIPGFKTTAQRQAEADAKRERDVEAELEVEKAGLEK
ncbi:hypothetical protein JCM1841_000364 [Sporobolomyces salmonicolor]